MDLKFCIIILCLSAMCFCKSHHRQRRDHVPEMEEMADKEQLGSQGSHEDGFNADMKSNKLTKGKAKILGNQNTNSKLVSGALVENVLNGNDILPALGNVNENVVISGSPGRNKYSYRNIHDSYEDIHDSYGDSRESYGNSRESYGNSRESYGNSHESYGNSRESYENNNSYGSRSDESSDSAESSERKGYCWIGGRCLFDKTCSVSCGLYNYGYCYLYRCLCFKGKYTNSPSV